MVEKSDPLTDVQKATYVAVLEHWAINKQSPSVREIKDAIGAPSPETVNLALRALTKRGWIRERTSRQARNIWPLKSYDAYVVQANRDLVIKLPGQLPPRSSTGPKTLTPKHLEWFREAVSYAETYGVMPHPHYFEVMLDVRISDAWTFLWAAERAGWLKRDRKRDVFVPLFVPADDGGPTTFQGQRRRA